MSNPFNISRDIDRTAFSSPSPPAITESSTLSPPASGEQSVTTTPQATLTFAAAPTAVTLVWKVLSTISPAVVASGTAFPIFLSLAVGMAIYLSAGQAADTGDIRKRAFNFFFALINSFAIAATTLGISSTLSGGTSTPVPITIPPTTALPSK